MIPTPILWAALTLAALAAIGSALNTLGRWLLPVFVALEAIRYTLRALAWVALRLALAVKRHPDTFAALTLSAALWWLWTVAPLSQPLTALVLAAAFIWCHVWPASFEACIENRLRARVRRVVYRARWRKTASVAGLCQRTPDGPLPPLLGRVTSPSPSLDILRIKPNPKQTPDTYAQAAHTIARGLKAHSVRAVPSRRVDVDLWINRTDPLLEPVPPLPPIDTADQLAAVPVGIRDNRAPFILPVIYNHLLIAGETGSGKGSVIWSLIGGMAPLIQAGYVELWVADPKQGLELNAGRPLFREFCWDAEETAEMLEAAVEGMRQRGDRMRQGGNRKHTPTEERPLIVIVIDEIASVTNHPDRALRERINGALFLLLSQGRAEAITVVMATQDARQDTLGGLRTFVPTTVALRMREANQAQMVLGPGARDRGAQPERISRDTPGVAYVVLEDEPDPVRVRFSHWTDDDIAHAVTRYARPAPLHALEDTA